MAHLSRCDKCITPCNCYVDEDGYWSNRPQDGRRNVNVSGSGTEADPIRISFMQSEFFAPGTSETRIASPISLGSAVGTFPATSEYDIRVYETPGRVFVKATLSIDPFFVLRNFHIFGATAVFNTSGTGERKLLLVSEDPNTGSQVGIAAATQPGNALRPTSLTCSGFWPGYLDRGVNLSSGIVNRRTCPILIKLYQDSGGALDVSGIKLWVTEI